MTLLGARVTARREVELQIEVFRRGRRNRTRGAYAPQKSPDSFARIFVVRLYRARLITQEPMCLMDLVHFGLCCRIEVRALRGFVIRIDRHELQTQFPSSRIELWKDSKFWLLSPHSVLTMPAARKPIATIARQINGHSAMSQKQLFRSEFLGLGFLFILLFSSIRRSQFHKILTGRSD